jgi:2-oxoglutarate ferredoxin oxidoreductase subunit gamma
VVTQSVVALAITVCLTKCLNRNEVIEAMRSRVPPKLLDVNLKAYEAGETAANIPA